MQWENTFFWFSSFCKPSSFCMCGSKCQRPRTKPLKKLPHNSDKICENSEVFFRIFRSVTYIYYFQRCTAYIMLYSLVLFSLLFRPRNCWHYFNFLFQTSWILKMTPTYLLSVLPTTNKQKNTDLAAMLCFQKLSRY